MLTFSVRRNISLVMFVVLVGMSAFFWTMDSTSATGVKEGVYTGAAEGFKSTIQLAITVVDGQINNIEVVSHDDTPGISDGAFDQLIPAIIAAQGTEGVEAVSGATATSKGIVEAFNNAFPLQLTDGEYTGVGEGFKSQIELKVVVKDEKIAEIVVLSHDDTPGLSDGAFEAVIPAIIDAQSTKVDTVSGATGTSNGIIEAVNDALK